MGKKKNPLKNSTIQAKPVSNPSKSLSVGAKTCNKSSVGAGIADLNSKLKGTKSVNVQHSNMGRKDDDSSEESDSDEDSRTLGDEDSTDSNQEISKTDGTFVENSLDSFVPETAPDSVGVSAENVEQKKKASFASLFADNRLQTDGSKLQQMEMEEGPVKILDSDLEENFEEWKFCLVGYFGGRFPGMAALQQIMSAWKVQVSNHFHNSGWIIFKFNSEQTMLKVLQEGPYMIYGRPLLLKMMPRFFKFENEELSTFPVWVQFRNLPLELWSNKALSRICSKLGKPVYTDKLTTSKSRISYARALVEVDVAKDIVNHIDLLLPTGEIMEQQVIYENLPHFCSHCKRVGHSTAGCKFQESAGNKRRNDGANSAGKKIENADLSAGQKRDNATAGTSNQFHALEGLMENENCRNEEHNRNHLQAQGVIPVLASSKGNCRQRIDTEEPSAVGGGQGIQHGKCSLQRIEAKEGKEDFLESSAGKAITGGKKKGKDKNRKKDKAVGTSSFCAGREGDSTLALSQ